MSNRNRSKTRQYRGPVPVASTQRIVAYSPSRGVAFLYATRVRWSFTVEPINAETLPARYPTFASVGELRAWLERYGEIEPRDVIHVAITIKGGDTSVTPEMLRRVGVKIRPS